MNHTRSEGLSDAAVLAIIAAACSICAFVWLWGGLAGILFGRGWPAAGVSRVLTVLTRLPARLGDPAAAWPARARPELPGPGGFYATLGVLGVGAAGFVLLARRAAGLLRLRDPGARWAAGGELRPLRHRAFRIRRGARRLSGRLILGRYRGRHLYAEERHALVAFGPPQSGKSAGLAVPALLEWQGPAVASSIKTDLLAVTIARRSAIGPVFVFDPFGLSGGESHTWSPLNGAHTWDGALEVAWRLAAAGELDQRGIEGVTSGRSPRSSDSRRCSTRRRAAAVGSARSSGGPTARAVASSTRGSRAWPVRHRRRPSSGTPTRRTTPCAHSSARLIAPARRSRRPPRRCCGPTVSRASPARRRAVRSSPTGCWTNRPRST